MEPPSSCLATTTPITKRSLVAHIISKRCHNSIFSLSSHQSNQPLLLHHCFPPITDFKGWRQSKSTHNMQVSWPACTSGGEHRTEHRAAAWPKFRAVLRSLSSTLAKISGSARYAALARLRSLLKPQKGEFLSYLFVRRILVSVGFSSRYTLRVPIGLY